MKTKLTSAVFLACALCVAGPARAQESAKEKAQTHYKRALAYEDLEQWTNAIAEYEAAFRLFPDPEFHYLIAELHGKLGKKREALAHYQKYLDESPEGRVAAEARAAAQRLQREIDAEPAAAAPGTGTSTEPPAASATPLEVEPIAAPDAATTSKATYVATGPPGWHRDLRIGAYISTGGGAAVLGLGLLLASGEESVSLGSKLAIGGGAAGIAAGIAMFVIHHRVTKSESKSAHVVPRVDGEVVALDLVGRF